MIKDIEGKLIFMTDPICSWCWGMLPEILLLRDTLRGRLGFEIKCAGLQVGSQRPLTDEQSAHLITLWQQVAETTHQKFAFELPLDASFIYHSELACRVIQIARRYLGAEPWDLFHDMQHAFYVDCRNLGDPDVLFDLLAPIGISIETFSEQLISDEIVNRTRDEFSWCESRGIQALPTLFLDLGDGPELIAGGYATAEILMPEIKARLTTH